MSFLLNMVIFHSYANVYQSVSVDIQDPEPPIRFWFSARSKPNSTSTVSLPLRMQRKVSLSADLDMLSCGHQVLKRSALPFQSRPGTPGGTRTPETERKPQFFQWWSTCHRCFFNAIWSKIFKQPPHLRRASSSSYNILETLSYFQRRPGLAFSSIFF